MIEYVVIQTNKTIYGLINNFPFLQIYSCITVFNLLQISFSVIFRPHYVYGNKTVNMNYNGQICNGFEISLEVRKL